MAQKRQITTEVREHWRENSRLVFWLLVVWAVVSYIAAIFVGQLNEIKFIGFPLGYYMGAQGSLVVFVVLIFLYSKWMDGIDEKHGVDE